MDPLVWQQTTNTITETVINHPLFLEATDIYCYANYNGETGTLAIMEEAWKLGKSVWFPRVEGGEMNFYLVEQKEDLRPGAYGILEPTGEYKADGYDGLLIMPGVAFDEECHRIGYGGGFYDRFDSMVTVAPLVEALILLMPVVKCNGEMCKYSGQYRFHWPAKPGCH